MKYISFAYLLSMFIPIVIVGCNSNVPTIKKDTIEIIQNFEVGKTYNYEVQRGKIDSNHPGTENVKGITDVEFKILKTVDGFKECSWKYGLTKIIGIDENQHDEEAEKLMNIAKGVEIKFIIDSNGVIQQITNYEECKTSIENTFESLYDYSSKKMTDEQYEQMKTSLKSTYDTPNMLVSSYFPELAIFFTMFGETIKSDSIYTSKSELPNPFGGRSFPTNLITKVDTIVENVATVSINEIIPSEDLVSIMKETFMELSKLSNKPFNEKDIPELNMTTHKIFDFDYKKNSLIKVSAERLMEGAGIKQLQTLTVILHN
jgi:hypothetical protein